jgi:hypothetical protein
VSYFIHHSYEIFRADKQNITDAEECKAYGAKYSTYKQQSNRSRIQCAVLPFQFNSLFLHMILYFPLLLRHDDAAEPRITSDLYSLDLYSS